MAYEIDYYNCEAPEYYVDNSGDESEYIWDPINLEYIRTDCIPKEDLHKYITLRKI